jgi:hypothetical protein
MSNLTFVDFCESEILRWKKASQNSHYVFFMKATVYIYIYIWIMCTLELAEKKFNWKIVQNIMY